MKQKAESSKKRVPEVPLITCILDYTGQKYPYVSENIQHVFGITAEELKDNGISMALTLFEETTELSSSMKYST